MTPSKAYLEELPLRLHHSARIIRDQERNRQFLEDMLGIPLIATWIEHVPDYQDPNKQVVMCHTFYELGDGSALAFFAFEKEDHWARVAPDLKERTGQYDHAALKVTPTTFEALTERLQAAGASHRILDHGYCRSLYAYSDQGYTLEFTCDPQNIDAILEWQRESAHKTLQRWTQGDRSSNNAIRPEEYGR